MIRGRLCWRDHSNWVGSEVASCRFFHNFLSHFSVFSVFPPFMMHENRRIEAAFRLKLSQFVAQDITPWIWTTLHGRKTASRRFISSCDLFLMCMLFNTWWKYSICVIDYILVCFAVTFNSWSNSPADLHDGGKCGQQTGWDGALQL